MAGFEYLALAPNGHPARGVIDGDAQRQARGLVRERGLAPLWAGTIREHPSRTGTKTKSGLRLRRGISGNELALLTRQFATLVRAGLTLEECLKALIGQHDKARTRHALAG